MVTFKETTVAYHCPSCGNPVFGKINIFDFSGDVFKLACKCGQSAMLLRKRADSRVELHVPCVFCPEPHKFMLSDTSVFGKQYISMRCPISAMSVCHIGTFGDVVRGTRESQRELSELLEQMQEYADMNGDGDEIDEIEDEDDEYGLYDVEDPDFDEDGGDTDENDSIDEEDGAEFELAKYGTNSGDGKSGDALKQPEGPKRVRSFDELLSSGDYTDKKLKIMRDMLLMVERLAHTELIYCRCTDESAKGGEAPPRAMDRVTVLIDGERIVLTCKRCGESRALSASSSLDCEKLLEAEFLYLE